MINDHKGVHKSYGLEWLDILELNDADETAKRTFIMCMVLFFSFMIDSSLVIF